MRKRAILTSATLLAAGTLLGAMAISTGAQERQSEPGARTVSALTPAQLAERLLYRRAVEAAFWGMPAVNAQLMYDAVKQVGGDFNQIVYWSRPLSSKNQTLTPNPNTIYVFPFYNTKDVGPMVLEIPPADQDDSITGSVDDAWQTALADVGPAGDDKGKGGKYLILPPAYKEKVPDGYIALRSSTHTGFVILRSNLKGGSEADIAKAVAYGKQIKFYPLSQANQSPQTKFVDSFDVLFDSTIPYDLRFFEALDRFVQREPWLDRDRVMIDSLRTIGIEKGKPFKPDEKTKQTLNEAVREAHAFLDHWYELLFATPYNEGTHLGAAGTACGAQRDDDGLRRSQRISCRRPGHGLFVRIFQPKASGRGTVLPRDHLRQGWQILRWGQQLSHERTSQPAGTALLVGYRVRPCNARADPRDAEVGRLVSHAGARENR